MSDQPTSGGVNQRSQIKMTDQELDEFLGARRTATMCTINPDGSIHAVAMWYGFLDGAIAFETKEKSQKVKNLLRDDHLTVSIETGEAYEELRGCTLMGRGEIITDPDRLFELGVSVFSRYQGEYTEEMKPFVEIMLRKRVVVKLNVEKTATWDHRKLGMPSTNPTAS